MKFKTFSRFALLLVGMVMLFICPANSQTNKCGLKLRVFDLENLEQNITETTAVLTDLKTKKTIKANSLEETPFFAELNESEYSATVSKAGYQKTVKEFDLDCEAANAEGIVSEIIALKKGDPKQTFEMKIKGGIGEVAYVKGEKAETDLSKTPGVVLGRPAYPPAARAVNASGAVYVEVLLNEIGEVVTAKATTGHPLLRAVAVKAAKESKFRPTLLSGMPVKVVGFVVYNFTL